MTGPGTAAPDPPPGAQAERTRLAWVRTAISMIVGTVVALRITISDVGMPAVGVAAFCATTAALVLLVSRHRYHRAFAAMDARDVLPDGRLPAVACLTVATMGLLVVAFALAS